MPLTIVPRKEWSGMDPRPATVVVPALRPGTDVFFLNTHTAPCANDTLCRGTLRVMQAQYMAKYSNDIRFNFMVGGDGTVYEGRGWNIAPNLPKEFANYAKFSISIAYVGAFKSSDVPEIMHNATKELLKYGIEQNMLIKGYLSRDIMLPPRTERN